MSTISVSELNKKPAKQWLKSAGKDDLVITSKGRPIAVLLRVASASVESTRALVRSVRALQAQNALQQAAVADGTAGFSKSDIDAEIAAARRQRRLEAACRKANKLGRVSADMRDWEKLNEAEED